MEQPLSFKVLVTVGRKHYMGNSVPATRLLRFMTVIEANVASDRVEAKNKLQDEFIYTAIRLY